MHPIRIGLLCCCLLQAGGGFAQLSGKTAKIITQLQETYLANIDHPWIAGDTVLVTNPGVRGKWDHLNIQVIPEGTISRYLKPGGKHYLATSYTTDITDTGVNISFSLCRMFCPEESGKNQVIIRTEPLAEPYTITYHCRYNCKRKRWEQVLHN